MAVAAAEHTKRPSTSGTEKSAVRPSRARTKAQRSPAQPKSSAAKAIPWPEILREAQQRFGIRRFRPGQREILDEVLNGRSALGLMPTGSGKSLTYQLPALLLARPVVVVSPLIALMQDQEDRATEADIVVEKLDSTLTRREQEKAEGEIEDGTAQLIYVTPERLEKPEFLQSLKDAGGISLLVVDEAHCIAQWGHDFRPAYLGIGDARRALGMPPVLALTATATEDVVREILTSLHAEDARIINTGVERENLSFRVHATVNTEAKLARVTSLLSDEEGTGIIYTASVRSADELHDWLKEHNVSVGRYHGKMRAREREQVQQAFMRGDHTVMIATKAFGLGIDKPDIRFVYHFEFPDSLETYYQEAGRAGRDGLPSHAVLLYRLEDKRIQSFFLGGRYPKVEELRRVLEAMAGRVFTPAPVKVEAVEAVPAIRAAAANDASRLTSQPAPSEEAPSAVDNETTAASTRGTSPELTSADGIAERAGVGRRKTQVILHLLQESGVIRRGRRGYVLTGTALPDDDALTTLLKGYTDRAQHDKDRLGEMMHYAEAVDCRVQIIRQYFNEEAGERCGRCDNCELGADATGPGGHAARVLDDANRQSADRASHPPENHRADEAHDGAAVTHIETMHGTIMTTAPETLPRMAAAAEEPAFMAGDRVSHSRFGEGTVRDVHDGVALVRFTKSGERKVKLGYLRRPA